jgi:hypothetical protein
MSPAAAGLVRFFTPIIPPDTMRNSIRFSALAVAVAFVAFSCSSTPPVGTVSGKVEFEGKPAAGGFISFMPKAGGTPITAQIENDGSYLAQDVLVGDCMVQVESPPPDGEAQGQIIKEMGKAPSKGPPPAAATPKKVKFPERYAKYDTSKLTVVVKPKSDGPTPFDVTMTK